MTDHTAMRMTHVRMMCEFIKGRCPDSTLFGTLADSWYAYYRGGVFVKDRTGNPRTLTNPTGRLELEAMRQLDWVSKGAGEVLFNGKTGRLVKEHSVPRAFLHKLALEIANPTPETVEQFLIEKYHVAALTKDEHDALEHRATMPIDWTDPYCRYAGLERYDGT